MITNRDLYRSVLDASEDTTRTLEEYLRALWQLGRAERSRSALPLDVVSSMLIGAVTAPVPPFDPAWRTSDLAVVSGMDGFEVWEQLILSQIADLRDFAEGPELSYPDFGVNVPRRPGDGSRASGLRWYNHNVPQYLECAMAGALGGWDPGDGIRKPLPGPSVQLYPEPQGVTSVPALTWADMVDLLECGQEYE
ncbi:hypothetical protein FKR81_19500 [Lentzea tibetensis]|uniref:Uncharacterized protein n=1 Tax=Lentzea tibetensis TaxID=2591470 RepID=A0A563ESV0_9PSEU|nr:hypothetical protein [Lentzea tibetensis]TWP50787.1 hypothetical protein FKR81_19500 [Lentzea tibetensis]